MALTPLQEALRALPENSGGPIAAASYRGVETAERFSDPADEYSAMAKGCGVHDLGFRAFLSIAGSDRVRWLNGMVTNNIRDLALGHGLYAFLLNPQGKILGDMNVYNLGETLLVETDGSQVEKLLATFDHYIIMDDVEVTNISQRQTALGLSGPKSREILNSAGIKVPEIEPLRMITPQCVCDCECAACTVVRGDDGPQESFEVWLAPRDVLKTWQALIAAGATAVGSEALEIRRIAAGVPLYGVDIRERDLPQETEQMRALNFNKGCYVGQEIVERIRSRGNVHRKFTGFVAEGAAGFATGDKVVAGDKEVGEITSVATLRTVSGEQTVALGYIRREVGVPGREVTVGTAKATVIQLAAAIAQQHVSEAVLNKV
jgi:folate-binding protein YgfZ